VAPRKFGMGAKVREPGTLNSVKVRRTTKTFTRLAGVAGSRKVLALPATAHRLGRTDPRNPHSLKKPSRKNVPASFDSGFSMLCASCGHVGMHVG